MKRKTYTLGGKNYKTKADIRRRARAIKESNREEVSIAGEDHEFMLDLLGMHPDAAAKIGAGVKRFFIRSDVDMVGSKCFWVERVDGSETDFSYNKCIAESGDSDYQAFCAACRRAVARFTSDFKKKQFLSGGKMACPITGEIMTVDSAHVDHMEPWTFREIIKAYITFRSVDLSAVQIGGTNADGAMRKDLLDGDLKNDFVKFHNARARYRLLSPRGNQIAYQQSRAKEGRSDVRLGELCADVMRNAAGGAQ